MFDIQFILNLLSGACYLIYKIHKPIWCSQCNLFPTLPAPGTVEKAEHGGFYLHV